MSTQTLTDLTLQTLRNYETAATQTVAAYQAGSQRMVKLVNGTLEQRVYPRTAKLAPRATARVDALAGNVHGIVVKGVDAAAERATAVIERGSEAAATRLAQVAGQVAGYAANLGNPAVANGLDTAARITLPVAQLALTVSGKVAEGATALASAAGAHPVKKALRAGLRKSAAAAQRAGKAAKARAAAPMAKRRRAAA